MTNLSETPEWAAGIYQIEQTDPVLGGPPNLASGAGIANVQAEQLAKRTTWLKQELATLLATEIATGLGISGGGAIDGGLALSADVASWSEAMAGTSSTKLMTVLRVQQVVDTAIDALVGAAPAQLDTLNELAAAITANGDTSAALTALIASKLDASAYTAEDILAKLLGVDGSGSGLDADKLDGIHADKFVRSDTVSEISNQGGVKRLVQTWAAAGLRHYIAPRKADDSNWDYTAAFGFDRDLNRWYFTGPLNVEGSNVWHGGNHGPGSGMNADMLDGKHASDFALAGSAQLPSAWVNFDGTGTVQIRAGHNVSSITDLGPGLFRINFATPMANTNYGFWGQAGNALSANDERIFFYTTAKTASYIEFETVNVNGAASDWDNISILIMGGQ